MAAVLLAGGDKGKRIALPSSRIMLHQPLGGTQGQAVDIQIHAREIMRLKDRIHEILVAHTGKTESEISADTDRDFFMSAEEAVSYGIIDKVIAQR